MEIAVSTSPNYNPERHLPPSRDQMGADQGDSGGRRGSSTSSTLPEPSTKY